MWALAERARRGRAVLATEKWVVEGPEQPALNGPNGAELWIRLAFGGCALSSRKVTQRAAFSGEHLWERSLLGILP